MRFGAVFAIVAITTSSRGPPSPRMIRRPGPKQRRHGTDLQPRASSTRSWRRSRSILTASLAQVLMASTYPLEVVQADRFAKANKKLKDEKLKEALDKQDWDASVKELVSTPTGAGDDE